MAESRFEMSAEQSAAGMKSKALRAVRVNPERGAAPLVIVLVFAFLGAALAGLAGSFFLFSNKPAPDNPSSLGNNSVYSLSEDRTGALWIGTFAGGLSVRS